MEGRIAMAALACMLLPGLAAWAAEEPEDEAAQEELLEVEQNIMEMMGRVDELQGQAKAATAEDQLRLIEQQIEGIEAALMRSEETADRLTTFIEIRNDVEEMLADVQAELEETGGIRAEIEAEGELELPAHRERREAWVAHMEAMAAVLEKIAALDDADELAEAMKLRRALEALEQRWSMVDEPRFDHAAAIAEMQEVAADLGDPAVLVELIVNARQLRDARVEHGERMFKLWQATRDADRGFRETMEQFHRSAEKSGRGGAIDAPPG